MASLTDTLSAPSGGKPIITTEVAAPDYLGAATGLLGGYIQAKENKTIYEGKQAEAQAKANEEAALDELASGVRGIMSNETTYVAPSEIQGHANKVVRMKRANLSPLAIDAAIQDLQKKVASKYPDQEAEIFNWLGERGFDDFMFREAKSRQKMADAELAAKNTAVATYSETLTKMGIDISKMSRSEIISRGAAETKLSYEYDEAEKRLTDIREANQEARAEQTHQNTLKDRREAEAEEAVVDTTMRRYTSSYQQPLSNLLKLANDAKFDPAKEKVFREAVQTAMLGATRDRNEFLAKTGGFNKTEVDRGLAWFDQVDKQLQRLMAGDMSSNQRMLEQITAYQSANTTFAYENMPDVMFHMDTFGQAGAAWLVEGLNESGAYREDLTGEVATAMSNRARGKPTPTFDKAVEAITSETPEDLATLKEKDPPAYNMAVTIGAGTLSKSTPELIVNPTVETAKGWDNSIRPVLFEATRISSSTPTDKHVKTVLEKLPPGQMILAVNNYEQVTGDSLRANAIRSQLETSYFNAFSSAIKDYTSNSVGSMLSPLKTSANPTMVGGVGGKVKPRVEFNEKTGRFEMNGRNQMYVWTGSETKNIVRDLNLLLDGIVTVSEQRTDSKAFPAGTSELSRRKAIVDGMNSEDLMDEILGLTEQTDSWNQTVSPVLVMQQATGNLLAVKEEMTKDKEVKKPTESKKPVKTPWTKMQTMIDQLKQETPVDDPFYAELKTVEDFFKKDLGKVNTSGTGSFVMGPTLTEAAAADPKLAPLLAKIDETETGDGAYNRLWGRTEESEFSNIDVTQMTLNELLEFTKPSGDYGQYVAKNRPDPEMGPSTPLGRYQIVGSTLRGLMKDMGLDGTETFTPELQDQMFLELYKQRNKPGKNFADEWQGLRGTEYDRKN